MTDKLQAALDNVEMTYRSLVEIANGMLAPIIDPINAIVKDISTDCNSMSINTLREHILKVQLKAYELSEIKEKSALKADVASALQKEAFAIKFNGMDGSASAKDKLALVEVSEEIATETLYNLVANLLKTKLDQLHRLVDSLKSILMSRMQETKFMNLATSVDIPGTSNGRIILNE